MLQLKQAKKNKRVCKEEKKRRENVCTTWVSTPTPMAVCRSKMDGRRMYSKDMYAYNKDMLCISWWASIIKSDDELLPLIATFFSSFKIEFFDNGCIKSSFFFSNCAQSSQKKRRETSYWLVDHSSHIMWPFLCCCLSLLYLKMKMARLVHSKYLITLHHMLS